MTTKRAEGKATKATKKKEGADQSRAYVERVEQTKQNIDLESYEYHRLNIRFGSKVQRPLIQASARTPRSTPVPPYFLLAYPPYLHDREAGEGEEPVLHDQERVVFALHGEDALRREEHTEKGEFSADETEFDVRVSLLGVPPGGEVCLSGPDLVPVLHLVWEPQQQRGDTTRDIGDT